MEDEEYFFQQYYSQVEDFLWFDEAALPPQLPVNNQHDQSAFLKYSSQPFKGFRTKSWGNHHGPNDQNVNRRMVEFLKMSWKTTMIEPVEPERERNHKHMMSERMRRVKQKDSFVKLHKVLPLGTKGDKNSIVQMAAETIQELQSCKEDLKRKNAELELALAAENHDHDDEENLEDAKIKLRVANPSSGIDSMLEVLKFLKDIGIKTKAIQSNFSSQEFSALLEIKAKIGAGEVEKAVERTLFEVERKFRCPF
ncbi:hypothetical protein ACH5RR_031426 [Cinchona calisaya]|uniref:BHLH domain-containing protein n=1 Tax=Cinchona calisaya TaxID=153742 RepID=A0ABD2YI63_9GENT